MGRVPEIKPRPEATVWDELVKLGEEIGRGWQSPLTSAELLSEIRRLGTGASVEDQEVEGMKQ